MWGGGVGCGVSVGCWRVRVLAWDVGKVWMLVWVAVSVDREKTHIHISACASISSLAHTHGQTHTHNHYTHTQHLHPNTILHSPHTLCELGYGIVGGCEFGRGCEQGVDVGVHM